MTYPNFIGLGAQKAGTSWIYACLSDHPDICMPFKEIHFFSKDANYSKGADWYRNHFESCAPGKVVGEFSTTYLHTPGAIERIHAHCPTAKLIVSLRSPVARSRSHFNNDLRAGLIDRSSVYKDAVRANPIYIERGLYSKQLEAVYNYFDRANVLVVILEDSYRDPAAFIKRIYQFIGAGDTFESAFLDRKVNISQVPRSFVLNRSLDVSVRLLRQLHLHSVVMALKKSGLGDWIRSLNSRGAEKEREEPDFLDDLPEESRRQLREDRHRLEKILGRSLDVWSV